MQVESLGRGGITNKLVVRAYYLWKGLLPMERVLTSQSRFERLKEIKHSNLDNRVKSLHLKLIEQLRDPNYDQGLGYTYKITKRFSDYEILSAAEYCARKATHPGKAFVALFEKKMAI